MSIRQVLIDEFEGKMLISLRDYERINKSAQPNSLLIKHHRGQAEMYAAVVTALVLAKERIEL